jgi:hypothetical protein
MLQRKLPYFDGQGAPLDDTLSVLSRRSGIDIAADWDSLAAAGVFRKTHVRVEFSGKTIMEELRVVLDAVAPPGRLHVATSEGQIIVFGHDLTGDSSVGIQTAIRARDE